MTTATIWNPKLITRERAANMCAIWDLELDEEHYLRCVNCGGNVTLLNRRFNVDTLLSQVLGHMVKCHNYSLSGAPND